MANLVTVENFPPANRKDYAKLSADVSVGATTVTVESINGFSTDNDILIGTPGAEDAEIRSISAVSGSDVTVDAIEYEHLEGTDVYVLRANQARIYRAENVDGSIPDEDSFSVLATVTFEADKLETEYEDTSGGSDYWYAYTLYNQAAASPTETDLDVSNAVRGGNYGNYVTADDVREEAGFSNNVWIDDALILSKLRDAQAEVQSSLIIAGYSLPLENVPQMVKNATRLLAAGYLLTKEYGPSQSGLALDGQAKIDQARELLEKIEMSRAELVNQAGETVSKSSNSFRGITSTSSDSRDSYFEATDEF